MYTIKEGCLMFCENHGYEVSDNENRCSICKTPLSLKELPRTEVFFKEMFPWKHFYPNNSAMACVMIGDKEFKTGHIVMLYDAEYPIADSGIEIITPEYDTLRMSSSTINEKHDPLTCIKKMFHNNEIRAYKDDWGIFLYSESIDVNLMIKPYF